MCQSPFNLASGLASLSPTWPGVHRPTSPRCGRARTKVNEPDAAIPLATSSHITRYLRAYRYLAP